MLKKNSGKSSQEKHLYLKSDPNGKCDFFFPLGVMLSVDFILFCYVDILYCVTEAPLFLIC